MSSKKIALIQGGMGSEREVSFMTGKAFAGALDELGYDYVTIDAGWDLPLRLAEVQPDLALIALHGKYAEDGTVQGLCEYMKIPYTGSGVLSSALCMDKYFTKQILYFNEIPTPDFELLNAQNSREYRLEPPVVVKPSRDGSSVGISICNTQQEIERAVELAAFYDNEVLLEKFIPGVELTVSILGDQALTPIEIVPKEGFYDYRNKYTPGQTDYILPPRVDSALIEQCQDLALKTHKACRARVFSRVDFRLSEEEIPFVVEINTLPGCTPTSLLPKSAAHDGISFNAIVQTLIERAGLDYERAT